MNERNAQEKYGKENIDVYHIKFTPLEEQILEKENEDGDSTKTNAYAKAIVHKESDKVLGLHYTGPNAGEIMQGFAVAMTMGLTKAQLDSTISIHPTIAEDITKMDATKTNGKNFEKTSCWGWSLHGKAKGTKAAIYDTLTSNTTVSVKIEIGKPNPDYPSRHWYTISNT